MSNCYLMEILPCVSAWNYQKIIANDHFRLSTRKINSQVNHLQVGHSKW